MARYVAYPSLVVSITMTTLHMDWSGRRQRDSKESETLIINVAGRLLILHRSEQVNYYYFYYIILNDNSGGIIQSSTSCPCLKC